MYLLAEGRPGALAWGPNFLSLINTFYRSLAGAANPDQATRPISELPPASEKVQDKIFRATSFCIVGDGQRPARRAWSWTSGVHCLPERQAQGAASPLTSAVPNLNRAPEDLRICLHVINSLVGAAVHRKFQDDAWGVAAGQNVHPDTNKKSLRNASVK